MLGGARSRQSPVPDLDLLVAVSSRWLSETTEVPSGGQEIALLERTSGAAISARRFPNSTGRSRAVMTAARGLPFAASPPTHCGEHSGGITAAMSRSNPLRLHQRSAFQPTHLSVGLTIVARASAPDASASTVRHGLHMPDDARMVFHNRSSRGAPGGRRPRPSQRTRVRTDPFPARSLAYRQVPAPNSPGVSEAIGNLFQSSANAL